jgi:hypothetical protein
MGALTAEAAALEQTAWVIIALAVVTFIALFWLKAPYGRYSSSASWIYGFQMDGKVAWILQVTAAPADAVTYQRTPRRRNARVLACRNSRACSGQCTTSSRASGR